MMNILINPNLTDVVLTEVIGLDTEFNDLRPIKAKISVISICNGTQIYVFEVRKYNIKELTDFLAKLKECKWIIAHNAKADQLVLLSNYGLVFKNWFCTMIASQIIDNGKGQKIADDWWITKTMVGGIFKMKAPHGLLGCLRRYLGIEYMDTEDKKRLQKSFADWKGEDFTKEQLSYAAGDVENLINLYQKELEYLKDRDLLTRANIKFKLVPVLSKCELKGVLVDQVKHKENVRKWNEKVLELEHRLDAELIKCGVNLPIRYDGIDGYMGKYHFLRASVECFNHASSKQVLGVFDQLGCVKPRNAKKSETSKSDWSVSDDNLKIYKAEHADSKLIDYVNLLFDYKVFCKKVSTYGQKLLDCLDDDGRMRTNYGIAFTDTLRLNSSSILSVKKGHSVDSGINLSNIPKDNDIRNVFISDKNYSFADCDMEGQEAIIAASYSQDPVLVRAFTEGFDMHSYLASAGYSIVFGREVKIENKNEYIEIDGHKYNMAKELRQDHKQVLFTIINGGGKERVYEYVSRYIINHNPPEQGLLIADKVTKKVKNLVSTLNKYLESRMDIVKDQGYLQLCKFGGRRYFDNPSNVWGEVLNAQIQGTASSCMDMALIKVDSFLESKSKELGIKEDELGWLSMSIYDQVLVSVNDKYLFIKDDIKKIMADSLTFFLSSNLKGGSSINIVKQWQK